jgi:hypothetical protein
MDEHLQTHEAGEHIANATGDDESDELLMTPSRRIRLPEAS